MTRDYAAAVQALNTLQTNFQIVDAIRKSGRGVNANAIPEMIEWCRRAGYEPSDLNKLNAIHVAGTKGKGSTSAFISSILNQYRNAGSGSPTKVGLYTSPHLRFVRERIQINGEPLSEELFAKYFFETWDRLEAAAKAAGHANPSSPETKPVYFRFLTLMAFHCYVSEGIDAAVIECGIGGEYDSTNILVQPWVSAVTSLGIDHVAMLGDTVESIAWHKAGVFKPGVPAFSAPQPDAAVEVLTKRAIERGTQLKVVPRIKALDNIKLGLAGDFQQTNASVAVAAAAAYLRKAGHSSIPEDIEASSSLPNHFRKGLEQVRLGGRCETRIDAHSKLTWFIDGGHTLDSIEMAGRWFGAQISASAGQSSTLSPTRVLIFNQQSRDAKSLAKKLHSTLVAALNKQQPFTHVIFCTNTTYRDTGFRPDLTSMNTNSQDVAQLSVQNALAETWQEINPEADVKVVRTIEEAVELARGVAGKRFGWRAEMDVKVLVTGSLHLVGGLIEVLEGEAEKRVAAQAGK
ncbi:putative tetrahydrofolylpolyglutamate synthase [Myriangium duriaei CBS 260.36]|uniref:Folylpolyglutamate synthase n=1 Tax=Myriangium duriaei CBS 260.36 TaxID=1168546 RepID=A0A9P4IVW3_9PEZI|nr:putative tetrahydrofolylpolyglutamate synthase [Myriangium duriaei CBS 260.36]